MDKKKFCDALRYLSTPVGAFWKWDEQGAVVVWKNGSTLAFREELSVVIGGLAPKGLPSFDALLLFIAATRACWSEDSASLQRQLQTAVAQFPIDSSLGDFVKDLFQRFDVIHRLSQEFSRSPEFRVDFAKLAFETTPPVVAWEVAEVVYEILCKKLNRVLPSLPRLRGGRVQTTKSLIHDMRPLCNSLQGVTKESFLLRMQTGLDTEPEPKDVDFVVDQTTAYQLLRDLSHDEELGGLSRLARNLAAVVQLPRSITDSDDLPLGGVSDISNRGTLDKLLLSELAHEDLMLATRIALNEALYLRREVPPSFPPERRHVLIDAGLRMWGVPRVFSTAVVLSFAASGSKTTSLAAYRASGEDIVPVDFLSREGLVSHLSSLEVDVHPGNAISEFFERLQETDVPGDAIIVIEEKTIDDPDFQRILEDLKLPMFYIATVNRKGDFQLWSRGIRGKKCHTTLRLDLDELLKPPQSRTLSLIDPTIDSNLPAILKVTPFPFRMPYQFDHGMKKEVVWSVRLRNVRRPIPSDETRESVPNSTHSSIEQSSPAQSGSGTLLGINPFTGSRLYIRSSGESKSDSRESTQLEYGVVVLTRDQRLLVFDDSVRGALQLADRVPYGSCLGAWTGSDGNQSFAIIFRESNPALFLLTIDLVENHVQTDQLPSAFLSNSGQAWKPLGATHHAAIVFVVFGSMIEAFDVLTKQLLASTYSELPDKWKRGRYFWNASLCHSDAWFALSFDGTSAVFQRVPQGKYLQTGVKLALFDRPETDGPCAVDSLGRIVNFTSQTDTVFMDRAASDLNVLDIDDEGRRILIRFTDRSSSMPKTKILDSKTGLTTDVANANTLAHVDAQRANSGLQPMRRMTRILIGDERLTLVSNGHTFWQFNLRANRIFLEQTIHIKAERCSKSFETIRTPALGYSLRLATWEDGSRAWVDSRGLLHLQSSDPLIPEVSFILITATAAWTDRGQMLGSSYYVDDSCPTISPNEMINDVLIPFVSRLR